MATEMKILGWEAAGLRCPDHTVNFLQTDDHIPRVSLIQMPNGTGKTTTLELLRVALSGSAADNGWDPKRVRMLKKRGATNQTGRFIVKLLVNSKRVTIYVISLLIVQRSI